VSGFRRKNIRLPRERYLGRQWYFLTACCDRRQRFFADTHLADSVLRTLRCVAEEHGFAVHAYCLMADHLHLLVYGMKQTSNALRFMREFKHRTGQMAWRDGRPHLWQKKFHDHILRRSEAVDDVAAYIWMNPVRKQLCERPEEYPFSGSFTLDWEAVRTIPQRRTTWILPWRKA